MKLVILDPGHFHAALLQKDMVADVDPDVHVYAPGGPDLDDYVRKIDAYNARAAQPTHWRLHVHAGSDYLERFAGERRGDVAVIAGNNARKTEYIERAVAAGFHTLADKPMAIDAAGFAGLERAFAIASERGVLLYDIMTERFEITSMLQKALAHVPSVFGTLVTGTPDAPAVVKESVHHFAKLVSGTPVVRPAWFFDTAQQGEGLVDITTHLVDLVQWACFPGAVLDGRADVAVHGARRWPTVLDAAQFARVTQLPDYPGFLRKDVQRDGSLHVYANGEIDYAVRGVHAKVRVLWNYEAPAGAGDTHYSVMRGSRANLVIRQGEAQGWQPALYVEPHRGAGDPDFGAALAAAVAALQPKHPGVGTRRSGDGWEITVPAAYHVGHEAHFGQVADAFLGYVRAGALPDWEVPGMLAKYWTTTQALALARR